MRITKHDKLVLFEQEVISLLLVVILSLTFYFLRFKLLFYLLTLLIGFILYFWMLHEEHVHKTGVKHNYFEHTSSYLIIAQTALVLDLLFMHYNIEFLSIIFLIISVIMYSVGISRIILFKALFKRKKHDVLRR